MHANNAPPLDAAADVHLHCEGAQGHAQSSVMVRPSARERRAPSVGFKLEYDLAVRSTIGGSRARHSTDR